MGARKGHMRPLRARKGQQQTRREKGARRGQDRPGDRRGEARSRQKAPEIPEDARRRQSTPGDARRGCGLPAGFIVGVPLVLPSALAPGKTPGQARSRQKTPGDRGLDAGRQKTPQDARRCQERPGTLFQIHKIIGNFSQTFNFTCKIEVCALKPRILRHTSACEDREASARLFRV